MRRVGQEAALLFTVTLLALIVWFVIADTENQQIEARLGFSLEVEATELSAELAVTGDPLPVTVTVIGREPDVEAARPEHFRATVSLRNRSAGRHNLPVRVDTLEGDVRVRAVQPETAVVILQETVEREVPVTVELANPPPLGFSVGDSEALPSTAIVSGLAVHVESVATVVARLDLGGARVSLEREVMLEARTAAGGTVSQVLVNPRFAAVHVPIEQEVFRRTYSILPQVVGVPAQGFRVRSIRSIPPTVDVLVSIEGLDEESEVLTGPIDITDVQQDVLVSVPLIFGATAAPAAESQPTTRVVVVIEPVVSSVTLPVNIEAVNLANGLALQSALPRTARVTLRGPVAVLSDLDGPLPTLELDLAGLSTGRHTVTLQWRAPRDLELTAILPAQLSVVLTEIVGEDNASGSQADSVGIESANGQNGGDDE